MKFDKKYKELIDIINEQDNISDVNNVKENLFDVYVVYRSDNKKPAYKGKFPKGTKLTISLVGSGKSAEEADKLLDNNPRFKI